MKAVMISIQPKWVEKICCGNKTIEVRKTRPKIDTPFKCYIYCTKTRTIGDIILCKSEENAKLFGYNTVKGINKGFAENEDIKLKGKVIGEFVCDRIEDFSQWEFDYFALLRHINLFAGTNHDYKFLDDYLKGQKKGYAWHISDLVIYDEPKVLGEFWTWKNCNSCKVSGYESSACCFDIDCKVPAIITRPPQSWCYVEEKE